MWGFRILTAASLLAGLAWSEASMNIGRALQGAGSALIAPAALTLLMTMFTDPKELGKAFGFWGASAAAGGSAGVFLGGLLTETLSWPWVFYINVPLGILVLLLSKPLLVEGMKQKSKLDLISAFMATLSLVLLVYGIVSPDQTAIVRGTTILVSVFLFVMFIVRQKRSKYPLLPLSIFKAPNLSAGNIVMMLMAGSWIPLWFYLNLYLQQVLELSAFHSGLALLPMTIVIMVLMVGLTGKLVAKFGFKGTLVAGLIALTGSMFMFTMVDSNGSFIVDVLPASIIGAIGMSLAYIPGTIASMSGAKPEETGLASGISNTSYQVGSAIGLAIIVAIATHFLGNGRSREEITESIQVAFGAAAVIAGLSTAIAIIFVKRPK
jgi:EmrB/QacA subfamily drug resistance transporter